MLEYEDVGEDRMVEIGNVVRLVDKKKLLSAIHDIIADSTERYILRRKGKTIEDVTREIMEELYDNLMKDVQYIVVVENGRIVKEIFYIQQFFEEYYSEALKTAKEYYW